jgi:hypothetical protein
MLYGDPDLYDALLPASEGQLNFYLALCATQARFSLSPAAAVKSSCRLH